MNLNYSHIRSFFDGRLNLFRRGRRPGSRRIIQFATNPAIFVSGGLLKLCDYMEHALEFDALNTRMYVPRENNLPSLSESPLFTVRHRVQHTIDWPEVAVMVISGWGWKRFIPAQFSDNPPFVIFFIVQSFFRIDPSDRRCTNLKSPAVRICVSAPLSRTLNDIDGVSGPVHVIPAGIRVSEVQGLAERNRDIDLCIVGLKNPKLASSIHRYFLHKGFKVCLLTERVSRTSFLNKISRARVATFLPERAEGFYLPALESMALGTLVVCPDVRGNDYVIDGHNAVVPAYTLEAIVAAVEFSLSLSLDVATVITKNAEAMALSHDIHNERAAFQKLLRRALADPTKDTK